MVWRFFDTELGVYCTPQLDSDGDHRCYPEMTLQANRINDAYSDDSCEDQASAIVGDSCADRIYASLKATTTLLGVRQIEQVTSTYRMDRSGDRAFRKLGANQQCIALRDELNASAYAVTEVPFDEFVRFESLPVPVSADLGVHVLQGEDGSRFAAGIWNLEDDIQAQPWTAGNTTYAVPDALEFAIVTQWRDFEGGPLVNLDCSDFTDDGPDLSEMSSYGDAIGLLIPEDVTPPQFVIIRDGIGAATQRRWHALVEDAEITGYCSIPRVQFSWDWSERSFAATPEGYTLYRVGPGRDLDAFPVVRRQIDARPGGFRFEHWITETDTPIVPVAHNALFFEGGPAIAFGFDGAFTVVETRPAGASSSASTEQVAHFQDSQCTIPAVLGSRAAGARFHWRQSDWCNPNDTPLFVTEGFPSGHRPHTIGAQAIGGNITVSACVAVSNNFQNMTPLRRYSTDQEGVTVVSEICESDTVCGR